MRQLLKELSLDARGYLRFIRHRVRPEPQPDAADFTMDVERDRVRSLVARIHPRRMKLRVLQIQDETPTTRTLRLTRVDGPLPPFRAGQYVNVYLEVQGVRTSRPYSIASAPGQPWLDITVRYSPEGVVAPQLALRTPVGTEIETSGPQGQFYHEPLTDGNRLVFLAGGSGLTPFMSMIRDQLGKGFPLEIMLIHGIRTQQEALFGLELEALVRQQPRLRYVPVVSEPGTGWNGRTGLLTQALLQELVGPVEGQMFYVCGPNAMLELVLSGLEGLGVPPHRVRRELYGPPADVTQEPGWPAGLSGHRVFQVGLADGRQLSARAGEPLLSSLEKAGLDVPALCRSGACSYCRTQLLSGKVFMPPHAGLRESDRIHGYIHPCLAYPLEDLRLRLG